MANKLIKRRYNNLLTARRNYFRPGGSLLGDILNTPGILGIVGQNPLDIIDLKNFGSTQAIHNVADLRNSVGTAYTAPEVKVPSKVGEFFKNHEGLTKAIGSAVGQVGGGLIGGGLQSGVGNAIQGIASAIPGPWGAVASAAGGLVNRMFGYKMNTENVAKVEANINSLNNFQSNASDFDTLSSNWANAATGMTFDNDFIGKDGWFSHKVRDKANSLRDQIETGEAWVQNVLDNNANNISETQMQNLLANYAAYGGPLFAEGGRIHIKPENRGKFTETKRRTGKTTEELTHSKNPLTRKRAIFALNSKKWHHAFGGDLMTHGANFDTGLTLVGNGGTHEENPLEGVPMGVDQEGVSNLVEEGEVIFNDYVFSNRLKVPKAVRNKYKLRGNKSLTFADAALLMSKESEERPNDPISQNGLEALLGELANTQEGIREKKAGKIYALGGNLFDTGGRKFGNNILAPYGWVRGYNAGNWMVDGNYTDDYKRRVGAMKTSDWQQHLKDLLDYYNNPSNRGTDRYKAIEYMYNANPWMKDYTVADADVSRMAELALSNPGFMHPYDVLQRQLDAEANPNNSTKEQFRIRQHGAEPIPFPEGETPWIGRRNGYLYGEDPDNPVNYKFVTSETKDGVTTHYYDPIKKVSPKKFRFYDYAEKYDKNSPYREYDSLDAAQEAGEDLSKFGAPKDGEEVTTYRGLKPSEKMPSFDNWMRYAPIAGSLTGLGMSLFSKPDESSAEAILEASRGADKYQPIKFKPVGNQLAYNPFDLDVAINQANAEAGAARRALLNTSGGNRALAMAGILAADNNALNQLGVLRRGAAEDNLKQRQLVEDFNRQTNMFNTEGFFKADAANLSALAQARDFSLRGTLAAEESRQRARLAHDNAIQANLSNLFTFLGNIGQERVARQQMKWMIDNGYAPGYGSDKKSKGGKIKRRKKGLTY